VEHRPDFRGLPLRVNEFGTLLGPEETPVGWGFLGGRFRLWLSNAFLCGCGGGCGGFGVWWCVECCIVDASILLCLVLWFEVLCC
jgi:hypothetical protein